MVWRFVVVWHALLWKTFQTKANKPLQWYMFSAVSMADNVNLSLKRFSCSSSTIESLVIIIELWHYWMSFLFNVLFFCWSLCSVRSVTMSDLFLIPQWQSWYLVHRKHSILVNWMKKNEGITKNWMNRILKCVVKYSQKNEHKNVPENWHMIWESS